MADELQSPVPSDNSSGGLKRRTTANEHHHCHQACDNRNQQPILTLSLQPSPANLEAAINGVQETDFPKDNPFTFSPKKPKLSAVSENLPPLAQEAVKEAKKENLAGSSFLEKDTQLIRGKCKLVQAGDESLNLDSGGNEFGRIELGKIDGNCGRNKAIVEELNVSARNCSAKQSVLELVVSGKEILHSQCVANEVGKAKEISKRLGLEQKNEGFLHKLVKLHFGASNADGLTCSVKVEVVDETALFDFSTMGGKIGKRRGIKINSSSRRRRLVYSSREMEALRFMNVKGQKKFWQQIYYSFPETVKREYDELGTFRRHHKPGKRHQNPGMRNYYGQGILGVAAARGTWTYPNLFAY